MSEINKVNNSPLRPSYCDDWTKLPAAKTFTIDFITPYLARNEKDVAKVTGLSMEFLDKIIEVEKLKNEKYLDGQNHPTIGIGHNIDADSHYKSGNKITNEQAYNLFAHDLKTKLSEIKELTGNAKLNTGQKEAIIDLLFNVGYGKLKDTKLIEKIKAGKIDQAVAELDLVHAGGKVNTGLCKRRMENVHEYSKAKPTLLAIKTLEAIKNEGALVFRKKAKAARRSKRKEIFADEFQYLKDCNKIITKVKEQLAKRKVFS